MGLGLAIAGFVRSSEQQAAIGNLSTVSTCMLGGVYWPLEVVPSFMQKIAEFVPQTLAMRGFAELIARGGGVADILGLVAILLGFAVVFLARGFPGFVMNKEKSGLLRSFIKFVILKREPKNICYV